MNAGRLPELLDQFRGTRVLTLGDVMLDEYVWGEVRRVSPEAPVPVVEIRSRTYVPGGAANTAVGVAELGGKALLAGVVGADSEAERLRGALRECGVDHEGCVVDRRRPTTTKTRIVAHSQQMIRADVEVRGSLGSELRDVLLGWVEQRMPEVDAMILSDYGKGVVSADVAQGCIELAGSAGKPVVVDPKGTDYAKYRGATVVTPNVHEVERAVNLELEADEQLERASRQLSALLDGSALLVTRGAQGMSILQDGKPTVDIPAVAHAVFDVTGAGDAVVSVLALGLACGASLEQAARLANAAAGIVVGKVGTAGVTLAELRASVV